MSLFALPCMGSMIDSAEDDADTNLTIHIGASDSRKIVVDHTVRYPLVPSLGHLANLSG